MRVVVVSGTPRTGVVVGNLDVTVVRRPAVFLGGPRAHSVRPQGFVRGSGDLGGGIG